MVGQYLCLSADIRKPLFSYLLLKFKSEVRESLVLGARS